MHIHDFLAFKRNLFITKKGGENFDYTTIHIGSMWDLKYTYPSIF